jgi:putative ABC transport system substrate-binding protein
MVQQRMDALFVSADGFLLTHSEQIVTLASWTAVPAAYGWRQAVTRGGLISYGTDFHASWRQAGVYTGRILTPDDNMIREEPRNPRLPFTKMPKGSPSDRY